MFHQHFNTPQRGGAIRSYYLATALARSGHQVTVITSSGTNTRRNETLEGIEVIYLPVPYNNRFKFYTRSWAFLRYAVAAIRAAYPYRRHEICYGISTPLTVGFCVMWMKVRHGMPYIFEVGDLWPDAPIELGYIENHLFKKLLFRFERSIYRGARTLVALSPAIEEAVRRKTPGVDVVLIPNMADVDFYRPESKKAELEERYQCAGKTVISYVGSLGAANGLGHLLECARASREAKLPFQFIVCGDGALLDSLQRDARTRDLDNVIFTGQLSRDGVKEVMNVTDVVFISYRNVTILETGSPNKYFDGLAAGKVVVVNFGGWIRKEVEDEQCGIYIDPMSPADFIEKVVPAMSNRERQQSMRRSARELAERKYSREKISRDFANLF